MRDRMKRAAVATMLLFGLACSGEGRERELAVFGAVAGASAYRDSVRLSLAPGIALDKVLDPRFLDGAKAGMSNEELRALKGKPIEVKDLGGDTIFVYRASSGQLELERRYVSSPDGFSGVVWELYFRPPEPLAPSALGPTLAHYAAQLQKGTGELQISPADYSGGALVFLEEGRVGRIFFSAPRSGPPAVLSPRPTKPSP